MVNLEWSVSGATSITIDQGVGDVSTLSSKTTTITASTTFTLTAKNAAGSTTATVSVSVQTEKAPFINSFTATPNTLAFGGGATTLTWDVSGATTMTIDQGVGDVSNVSSRQVNVLTTTTFTLTAVNAIGSSMQTVVVTVGPDTAKPTIVSFTAANQPPVGGGAVVLNWAVNDATSLTLGDNLGNSTIVTGTTTTVQVPNDLTFTLTASNANGSVTAMLAFAVTPPSYLNGVAQTSAATGLEYGAPYDSIIGGPILSGMTPAVVSANCTDPSGLCESPVLQPVSSTSTVTFIQSDEDYFSALQIDASASVSAGIYSGNAKLDYYNSNKLDSLSVYLFIDVTNITGAEQVNAPALTPQAQALDAASFYRKYGDRYAYLGVEGGEVYGLLQITATTVEEKQNITTAISGSVAGSGSFSSSVATQLDTALASYTIHANINAIGYTQTSVPQIANAQDTNGAIAAFYNALQTLLANKPAQLGNGQYNTLYFEYASYFGLPGYPGLPSTVPALVTQHRQAESDYFLYTNITTNQTDFGKYWNGGIYAPYVVSGTILSNMKQHATDLGTWISDSLSDSLDSPAPPTPAGNADISGFAFVSLGAASSNMTFNAYGFTNGFLPYHLADYDIPARYADSNGNLGTAKASTYQQMKVIDAASDTETIPWQLYQVNEDVAGVLSPSFAYQWPNQLGEYFLPSSTMLSGNGQVTAASFGASLGALTTGNYPTMNRWYYTGDNSGSNCNGGTCETGNRRFLFVNAATGMVMTEPGSEASTTQTVFNDNANQFWGALDTTGAASAVNADPIQFTVDNGGTEDVLGNLVCYDLNLAGNGPWANDDPVLIDGSRINSGNSNEHFALFDAGNGFIDVYQFGALTNNVPTFVVGIQQDNSTCTSNCFPTNAALTLVPRKGYVNERWHLVPFDHVYLGN